MVIQQKKTSVFDLVVKKIMGQLIQSNFLKKSPVILVNGLAEQYESWFFNVGPLGKDFVVQWPNLYWYTSENYHKEIHQVSVSWVAKRLKTYLDDFVQTPPYHLVGSSSGCQTIVTLASQNPDLISKLVLICPSGLGGEENLPMVDGVGRRDLAALIGAIFYDKKFYVLDEIVAILKERFDNRKWRLGFVRMAQVTKRNCILNELAELKCPVLFICGEEDEIVPIWQAYRAAKTMRDNGCDVQMIVFPKCGHAPQIERAQLTNKYISEFLKGKLQKNGFWRHQNGILQPFDLDKMDARHPAKNEKTSRQNANSVLI